jgi:hypothetical protein
MTNDTGKPGTSGPDAAPAEDDVKRKFRDALAAKSKRNHEHVDDRPDQRFDTHGAAGNKRMFRRKSGS